MPRSERRDTNKLKQMDSGRAFDHHCCFTLMRVSVKIQGRALAQNGSNPTLLYSNVSMFSGSKEGGNALNESIFLFIRAAILAFLIWDVSSDLYAGKVN